MQKIFLQALLCLLISSTVQAQIFDRIKNKVNQKVNDAVDKTIDNAGKKKKDTTVVATTNKVDTTGTQTQQVNNSKQDVQVTEDVKAYSKFDFVPGEKIIAEENFSQDAIGDFPDRWNTNASGEVVTINNKPGKWLRLIQDGNFFPEFVSTLPDNFTFQMDMMCTEQIASIAEFSIAVCNTQSAKEKLNIGSNSSINKGILLRFSPKSSGEGTFNYFVDNSAGEIDKVIYPFSNFSIANKMATLSIWRQKQRIRVYVNQTKVLDLPKGLDADAILNSLILKTSTVDFDKKGGAFFVSNLRLAVGAPDTRNKLITVGKFVTHGILFDVNSDKIKAPSYGALQDIASVLKENATVRVKIIGHTDSDGDDKINLDLSKRRAEAVKAALITTFGIDGGRLETDGKGKTQPIDVNTTPEGKANNRRVEFIKL